MKTQMKWTMAVAMALVAVACAKVEKVSVEPKSLLFTAAGQTQQVTAAAADQNGKAMEKVQFTFTSSDPSVATVDATGKVTAVKSGSASISAKASEKEDSAAADVKIPAKLSLNPAEITITGLGGTAQLDAKVLDEINRPIEGAAVNFAVANPTVAQVADKTITAQGAGETKITATFGALTQDLNVKVALPEFATVAVEPAAPALKIGESAQLTATVKNAEGAAVAGVPVTYTTSDEKVATVDPMGKITAVAAGSATVEAKAGEKTTSVKVSVKK